MKPEAGSEPRYDVAVVGAGAAGLMAAGRAREKGAKVLLCEGSTRPGRKLLITGKGRCNLTNDCGVDALLAAVERNPRFLYSAFSRFSPADTMEFFEGLGVPLKVERGKRVFPCSDRSVDVADALVRYASGVSVARQRAARVAVGEGRVSGIVLADGGVARADAVVLATGGLSYPATGSTGDGYRMAKELGHSVTALRPSLVPLVSSDPVCPACQGLSLKNAGVAFYEDGKKIFEDFGEMLFTHFGLSGPCVLSGSARLSGTARQRFVAIDLKPALDEAKLDARLLREIAGAPGRALSNLLGALLPSSLAAFFPSRLGLPPEKKSAELTREERLSIVRLLKKFTVAVDGTRPIAEAVVTAGGVAVKEVDPKTMESKLVPGLYFAGELLDVDACTGGFNLQIAFSTGRLAGESAAASARGN